jgi:hypothetical protein
MEWDTMTRLAERSRSAKTELLINFQSPKIDRDAGWLDSYGQPAQAGFINALNALMGTKDWQPIIQGGFPRDQRDEHLTSLYATRLASIFRGIVGPHPVRTIQGQLKYYVLHVTGHPRGCREMSDVIYRVEVDYRHERERITAPRALQLGFDDILAPPLTVAQVDASIAARLAEDISSLRTTRKEITFGAIQDELTKTYWFGQALEKHYRSACKQLLESGRMAQLNGKAIKEDTLFAFV